MGLPVEVNNLMLGSLGGYTVGRSLRFRSSASAYLNRTPASASNQTTWTWSGWVKKGNYSSYGCMFGAYTGAGATYTVLQWQNDNTLVFYNQTSSSITMNLNTTQVFRDPSAWYHVVAVYDSTQATASNRGKIYINGVQVTAFSTATYPSLNANATINSVVPHDLGRFGGALNYFDGYLAEVNFIDGQALTPSSFGAYDTNGVWQPKKYSGTYGTNGFYLPFTSGFNTTQTYAGGFNGSNQYLSLGANAAYSMGTGDFTFEANVNFNALPSASAITAIFGNETNTAAAANDKFWIGLYNSAGQYQLRFGRHNAPNGSWTVWTPTIGTWYHIAIVRQSGVISIYINGVSQTMVQASDMAHSFGQNGLTLGLVSTPYYMNGYISNARYVVGSAVYTTGFTPPSANLTAITNTKLLTLQNATIIDNSSLAATITNTGSIVTTNQYPFQYTLASVSSDYSGNSNNWTANNINSTILGTTYDSMIDSPTPYADGSTNRGNYCTLNPIAPNSAVGVPVLSNGNLTTSYSGSTKICVGTHSADYSGSWYYEVIATLSSSSIDGVGWTTSAATGQGGAWTDTNTLSLYAPNGQIYKNGWVSGGWATYTTGDVIGVGWSNGTVSYYKNNVLVHSYSPSFSTSAIIYPCIQCFTASSSYSANFGQRPFAYTPPSGYKALNTYNLPAPSIANGAQYMAATTYTGNGGTQSISNAVNGVSFQPDFVWIKNRAAAVNHQLQNSNAGWQYGLNSNTTSAEFTDANAITGSTSSGWSMNNNYNSHNQSGVSYVGWQWKAGGTGVTNTAGTITSTVSANPSAGFSVVTYVAQSSGTATIGHGLGVAPNMIIIKSRASAYDWAVYHSALGNTQAVRLNLANASNTDVNWWNNTSPTSSVFTVGANYAAAGNTVAYCFSAVSGYSAFGKYTGNGSADGPFVFTNFRPRWLLLKNASGAVDWILYDTSRSTYNVTNLVLQPSQSAAEVTAVNIDVLSNGFKIRTTDQAANNSGQTYIYAAFAESPFQISRAR